MSDLTDFVDVDGVSDLIDEPEHQTWLKLSRWFSEHGNDVYWEEDPTDGQLAEKSQFDTFAATTNERADLLVVGSRGVFVVEVKPAEDTSTVHSGFRQTGKYWEQYVNNETEYKVDGSSVDVDAFLFATTFSPEGSLYPRYFETDARQFAVYEEPRWADWADPPFRCAPDYEYKTTESMTRYLWEEVTSSIEQPIGEDHPGIGYVASSTLDADTPPIRTEEGGVDPFEDAYAKSYSPMACYKRPVVNAGSGPACHNWGWI